MKINNRHLIVSLSALFLVSVLGTVTFKLLEDWTWIESLHFTIATITTVGYGDLYPTTDVSRLANVVFLLLGVSAVLSSLTLIGTRYLQNQERILEKRIRKVASHVQGLRTKK